ncbi:MAG: DUF3892 domain-containing protein [Bellilinea sp.]
MAKWADYCISRVRYNEEHSHIVKLEAMPDNGEKLGNKVEFTREDVVAKIDSGITFITVTDKDGKWTKGEDVRIVRINDVKYIRTDQNQKESDNLGSLPEY